MLLETELLMLQLLLLLLLLLLKLLEDLQVLELQLDLPLSLLVLQILCGRLQWLLARLNLLPPIIHASASSTACRRQGSASDAYTSANAACEHLPVGIRKSTVVALPRQHSRAADGRSFQIYPMKTTRWHCGLTNVLKPNRERSNATMLVGHRICSGAGTSGRTHGGPIRGRSCCGTCAPRVCSRSRQRVRDHAPCVPNP